MTNLIALAMATIVLVLIPGPNVALIIANSLKHGMRAGFTTVVGTTVGVGIQLWLMVFGLTALLGIAVELLIWIKWIGAAYLIYLGIKTWREPVDSFGDIRARTEPVVVACRRGVLLALINPKTLVFNAAFLPQFIAPGNDYAAQLCWLSAVFLFILALGDALWVVFAGVVRAFSLKLSKFHKRLSGGFFVIAGIGLTLAHEK